MSMRSPPAGAFSPGILDFSMRFREETQVVQHARCVMHPAHAAADAVAEHHFPAMPAGVTRSANIIAENRRRRGTTAEGGPGEIRTATLMAASAGAARSPAR